MRAAGAAILGAAAVGAMFMVASNVSAKEDSGVIDLDAELQLGTNYYGMALANPEDWSNGQLISLSGFLVDLGMVQEAQNIEDLRMVMYDGAQVPAEPLPDIHFIPPDLIDLLADEAEEANA